MDWQRLTGIMDLRSGWHRGASLPPGARDVDLRPAWGRWFWHRIPHESASDEPANTEGAADELLSRVEAALILAKNPLGSRKLAQLTGLADGTKARTLVRTLNRRYDRQGSAFRVEEVAGGFQLLTRVKFAPWLRRLHAAAAEVRLSAPVLETLAVVAYRQPVLRADVEAIRGVQCDEVLRQLMDRDLVRVVGRSEELGRPLLYGTTRRFLQVFGLRHLDELPRAEEMRATKLAAAGAAADVQSLSQPNDFPKAEEETNVSTCIKPSPMEEELAARTRTAVALTERNEKDDDTDDVDKDDEDLDKDDDDDDWDDDEDLDEDEDEDDEDFEDSDWEEVEDDDLEDEDWDDDEDEDWEDDEDDDWDEDDEEEDDKKDAP